MQHETLRKNPGCTAKQTGSRKQIWSELRSCVKVEVAIGSSSLIVRTVSVDVKQNWTDCSLGPGAV